MATKTFLGYFFHGNGYSIVLPKNGLGHVLGHIFTNSSGHPANIQMMP
jgi:hypothetical protein